jgi:thymidylate synthase
MNKYDKDYQALLAEILERGTVKEDRTGTGTHSVFGRQLRIDLREGFPLLTTKRVHYKSVLAELLWFIEGGDNIRPLLQRGCTIWSEWPFAWYMKENFGFVAPGFTIKDFEKRVLEDEDFAAKWGGLGPVYGSQWVNWNGEGLNQLQIAINDLRYNPDSRRIMVTAWNPGKLREQLLPPCHYAFQFWTRPLELSERVDWLGKNRPDVALAELSESGVKGFAPLLNALDEAGVPSRGLSLMFHMRSVDSFLGMPFDIASFATLQHMVAQVVNMVPEELVMETGDTHIYRNHVEQVRTQLGREPMPLPRIQLDPSVKDIFQFSMDGVKIIDYVCHSPIKADVAV